MNNGMEASGGESDRTRDFPVCRSGIFMAHAAVTALPRVASEAMCSYSERCASMPQEFPEVLRDIRDTRRLCAEFIGAGADEVALLGPTSLGLSLFANGLDWREGDEVVFYAGDYPANVYPWRNLERIGVISRPIPRRIHGRIEFEDVEAVVGPRTRLVALASANYLSGFRPNLGRIGGFLRNRGVKFAVDGIQTVGAFRMDVENDCVDLMSADAHKWMLGPMAMGIVYVSRESFESVRPTLLGAWNVHSPDFVAVESMQFVRGAQRYEPGVLNTVGMYGMAASLGLIAKTGQGAVEQQILALADALGFGVRRLGFELMLERSEERRSGIVSFRHPTKEVSELYRFLVERGVSGSLRSDGFGGSWIRLSPHFYNTVGEVEAVLGWVGEWNSK
jgi:selenocysteine lyase/cysteine desulfurase